MSQTSFSSGSEALLDRLRRAVIGRYDVYAELGQGGMASVFLALDLALERKVAIKVMSPALAGSADNIERFKREAKVAAALNHPNIIGILAVGDDPELAYFVMKFVEGRSLDSVIRDDGPQAAPFVRSVIASAGKALHYAHTRGVIHRDVKPANFMLDQDGWLVVTDFGIAKQEDAKGLTATGSLMGTPYYMAPEQFHGKPVSPAADQYALGIVAYELLAGTQPYAGETLAEVMRGHLFDAVPDIRALRPEVPAEVADCISRMLAKEPAERFATLEDAVLAFGAVSPTQELQVRTQIIALAKSGVMQQPRINVPVSPVPVVRTRPAGTPASRPPARTAPGTAPGTAAGTAPGTAQLAATTPVPVARPRRAILPVLAAVGLLLAAGGATAVLRPELFGLAPRARVAAPAATTVDTADGRARDARDAQGREQATAARIAAAEAEAAAARALVDSMARADSIARVVTQARTDSIARADSVRRAAALRPTPTGADRPAVRQGAAALLKARRDARRTTPPTRKP
jgi:eukaryotic-like serine/threonine-protein kinase